jgi:hypothetical protein
VFLNSDTGNVVAIMFFPPVVLNHEEARLNRSRVKFVTSKGARYGHSIETIEVMYGKPGRIYSRGNTSLTYYYPDLRTEFLFVCDAPLWSRQNCKRWSMELEQMRIYADGWSPERLWGPGYAKGE